jgi:hypothetical protein
LLSPILERVPRMVRDDQVDGRVLGRLRAILAAIAALLLALAPVQRAETVRHAHAQFALSGAEDASLVAPERASWKRYHAASLDADPAVAPASGSAASPDGVSRLAATVAATTAVGATWPDLPPARGPPAPVA